MGVGIPHAIQLTDGGENHREFLVRLSIHKGDHVVLACDLIHHLDAGELADRSLHGVFQARLDINHDEGFRHGGTWVVF